MTQLNFFKMVALSLTLHLSTVCFSQTCPDYSSGVSRVSATCSTLLANNPGYFNCSSSPYSNLKAEYITMENGQGVYICHSTLCSNGSDYMWDQVPIPGCASMPTSKESASKYERQNQCPGSIIQVDNEILGESIPIVGASFSLNYFSNYAQRIADYKFVISPVANAPSGISSVSINITTPLPSTNSQSFPSRPTTDIAYTWNGNDGSGNPMWGTLRHTVAINETRSLSSGSIVFSESRLHNLGSFKAKKLALGGWVPSNYNFYDSNSETLYRGDGSTRKVSIALNSSNLYVVPETDGSLVYEFNSLGLHRYTKLGIIGTIIATFAYDSANRLISITEPFSLVTTFNRDGSGKLISITTPGNKVTSVVVNTSGFLTSLTNPLSENYLMTYNTRGILLTFQKPNAALSTFTYDSDDRLTKDEHSAGFFQTLTTTLNSATQKTQTLTSKMGRTKTFDNTPQANPMQKTTFADNSRDEFVTYASGTGTREDSTFNGSAYYSAIYQPQARFGGKARSISASYVQGAITRSTTFTENFSLSNSADPFSITTWTRSATTGTAVSNLTYTGSTKTFVETSPLSRTMTYKWDTYQRPTYIQQGGLLATSFAYTNDKLTSVTQGTRVSSLSYHPTKGVLSSITNPLNQTTSFTYNAAERLTAMTLPDLRVINFNYNSNGNLASVTPSGKPVHTFSYSLAEILASYVPPALTGVSTVSTSYTYNDDKQLTQILRPDGQAINLGYNVTNGKITSLSTPQRTITYSYLNASNLLNSKTLTYAGGSMRYENEGRIVKSLETNYNDGIYSVYSYTTYPDYGYLKSDKVDSNGAWSVINYGYDADGLLTSAGSLTLTYNIPNGQLTGTALGTISDSRTYNTAGELLTYQGKINSVNSYGYTLTRDALGRVATKSQTLPGVGTDNYSYVYDSTGRLTQVTKNSAVVANYGYDGNNNRVSGNIGSQTTTGIYDAQDRLTSYNTYSFTYNANGDLLTKTNTTTNAVTQYTYDALGNLTKVILPNATVIDYEIDGLNRRVGKKVNGVLQRRYFYMDQYRIAAEINPDGTILRRYVYASQSNIPDYYIEGGNNYKIFADHLGSFRMSVRESTGATICKQDNDEFGRVILSTVPGCVVFGFAGGLYDSDTGLVRFGARDYDPETGRWASKDPILFRGGQTNLYGYVMNDPINWIDPLGLSQEQIDSAMDWLGATHPELTQGAKNATIKDSVLGSIAGEDGITLGNYIFINTKGMTDKDVVGMVAHELLHYKDGFWKTLFPPSGRHDSIYGIHGKILNEYDNYSGSSKGKGNKCP